MPELMPSITSLQQADIKQFISDAKQPDFRATQILDWIYQKRVTSFDEMSNLPLALRTKLKENYQFITMSEAKATGSEDTTEKFLFKLFDNRYVETVLIPANPALYSDKSDRHTACVSSQVGCAFGCKFCASGLAGFTRNLTTDEIIKASVLEKLQFLLLGSLPRSKN